MSAYNDARYLSEAVESVLSQKDVDFEFIIVDDGSQDDSASILRRYEGRDHRVRVIHKANEGLTQSLIVGCREARGEFIARQDADDISAPDRLRRLSDQLIREPRIVFVSSWAQIIGPTGHVLGEITKPDDPLEATDQLLNHRQGPPGHGTVMFRRRTYEQVGGYRKQFYYGQDSDLWLRLASQGPLAYEQAFLYRFRYSPDAISGKYRDLQRRFGEIGQACFAARRSGQSEAKHLALAEHLTTLALARRRLNRVDRRCVAAAHYFVGCGLTQGGRPGASHHFWRSLGSWPLYWRAWVRLAGCPLIAISRVVRRTLSALSADAPHLW